MGLRPWCDGWLGHSRSLKKSLWTEGYRAQQTKLFSKSSDLGYNHRNSKSETLNWTNLRHSEAFLPGVGFSEHGPFLFPILKDCSATVLFCSDLVQCISCPTKTSSNVSVVSRAFDGVGFDSRASTPLCLQMLYKVRESRYQVPANHITHPVSSHTQVGLQ